MACPIHLWIPLMAAAAPAARYARNRLKLRRALREEQRTNAAAPHVQRWAPVGAVVSSTDRAGDHARTGEPQA
jgi:hypothetical protein